MAQNQNYINVSVENAIRDNYMPYAMTVVISRALPLVYDGLKPSHRKLLYTMYLMKLLKGNRTKCANIVGQTMKLNPHGDSAIYETLVRLTKDYEALNLPLIDSKGNFGKVYSRDMAFAASRYTEAKLADIADELFKNIDNVVDFHDNYDGQMKEPSVLPATFPNILCNPNQGIAVGMASNIASFNLNEVCDETINLLKDENHEFLLAPDFSTGAEYFYDPNQIKQVMETGRGSFKLRAKYEYIKKENIIEVTEIPYTTSVEAIIDKISDLVKIGKVKEISDILDGTDLSGMKLTIYLKRGTNPDLLMAKLFKLTPLEDTFSCNFNVLIRNEFGGLTPKVLGAREILKEWIAFRIETIKRELTFDLEKVEKKIHLLKGFEIVALDLDKTIELIRQSKNREKAKEVVKDYFNLTDEQAESIGNINLYDLNEDYFLKRIKELESLNKTLKKINKVLNSEKLIKERIEKELLEIKTKYGKPRKTEIIYEKIDLPVEMEKEETCYLVVTNEYYVKLNARYNVNQRLKDGDSILMNVQTTNLATLLIFTDKANCYKLYLTDLEYAPPSSLGTVLRHIAGLDDNENIVSIQLVDKEYSGYLLNVYENNKIGKIKIEEFKTESKRSCLKNALGKKSPLMKQFLIPEDEDVLIQTSNDSIFVIHSSLIDLKSSKGTIGETIGLYKKNETIKNVFLLKDIDLDKVQDIEHYRITDKKEAGTFILKTDYFPDLKINKKKQMSLL